VRRDRIRILCIACSTSGLSTLDRALKGSRYSVLTAATPDQGVAICVAQFVAQHYRCCRASRVLARTEARETETDEEVSNKDRLARSERLHKAARVKFLISPFNAARIRGSLSHNGRDRYGSRSGLPAFGYIHHYGFLGSHRAALRRSGN
jgi:hypothetical protein